MGRNSLSRPGGITGLTASAAELNVLDSSLNNVLYVGPGCPYTSVQAAVTAAAAAYETTGELQTVQDYTGGLYTVAPGVKVVQNKSTAVPVSDIARPGMYLAYGPAGAYGGLANSKTVGIASKTYWRAVCAVDGIRFLFPNFGGNIVPGGDDLYVWAKVQVDGVSYTLTFDGVNAGLVPWGGYKLSDPLAVTIAANTIVECDTSIAPKAIPLADIVDVDLLGLYPKVPGSTLEHGQHNGYVTADSSDISYNDINFTGDWGATASNGYAPLTMLGYPTTTAPPAMVVIGDSILMTRTATHDIKSSIMGLVAENPNNAAYVQGYAGSNSDVILTSGILDCLPANTVIVTEFGVNSIPTGSSSAAVMNECKRRLLDTWAQLRSRGFTVYQTLITPVTKQIASNTDYSVANQEAVSAFKDANTFGVNGINAWIINEAGTVSSDLEDYIDVVTPTTEVNGVNGHTVWKYLDASWDGIHPRGITLDLIAKAVSTKMQPILGLVDRDWTMPSNTIARVKNSEASLIESATYPKTPAFHRPSSGGEALLTRTAGVSIECVTKYDNGAGNSGSNSPIIDISGLAFPDQEASMFVWVKPLATSGVVAYKWIGGIGNDGSGALVSLGMNGSKPAVYGAIVGNYVTADANADLDGTWQCYGFSLDLASTPKVINIYEYRGKTNAFVTSKTDTATVANLNAYNQAYLLGIGATPDRYCWVCPMGQALVMARKTTPAEFTAYVNATKLIYGL